MTVTLYHGDCLEIMRSMEDKSINAVITDPPYSTPVVTGFGRQKVKNLGDLSMQNTYFRMIESELDRILKPDGRLFVFCDDKYYPVLFSVFYEWQNTNLVIWDKGKIGMGNPFRKQHELIFYANREAFEYRRTENITHYSTVLKYKPVENGKREHPAQKPTELIGDLLLGFSDENNTIFDPFMGSGTTGVAAVQLGRNFIGCEINRDYFEIAQRRIEEAQKQMVLFV